MSAILAIDPGNIESAIALIDSDTYASFTLASIPMTRSEKKYTSLLKRGKFQALR